MVRVRGAWRQRLRKLTIFLVLTAAPCRMLPASQASPGEFFDTAAMPQRPRTFIEQQILEMIGSHTIGDLADTARIQRKLGRYYADKGDEARSSAAFRRAAAAEETLAGGGQRAAAPSPKDAPKATKSKLTGNYFGYEARTLHTWEFASDGAFLHTSIASGAGTAVRNSERGRFSLAGDFLVLEISSSAGGFATPGVAGRSTQLGGGGDRTRSTRRATIRFLETESAIMLDGIKLKPKSW